MKADQIAEMAMHVVEKAKVAAQPTDVAEDEKGNAMNPGKSAMGLWAERMGGGNPGMGGGGGY